MTKPNLGSKEKQYPVPVFIVGVQKSGTTTLANALARHDQFTLSNPKEPMIFSSGDIIAHRHMAFSKHGLFFETDESLIAKYETMREACATNYFLDASTSYFQSQKAIKLIAKFYPDSKIIIVIRDPVARVVSAYWHAVRNGTAIHHFERHLEFSDNKLITLGFYQETISHWCSAFGKKNVFVTTQESMIRDSGAFSKAISDFLGTDVNLKFQRDNEAQLPIFFRGQLFINYLKQISNLSFYDNDIVSGRISRYGLWGLFLHSLTKMNLRRKSKRALPKTALGLLGKIYRKENLFLSEYVNFGSMKDWSEWDV